MTTRDMLCVTYLFTLLLYLSKKEIAPADFSAGAIVRTEAADLKINCLCQNIFVIFRGTYG